MNSKSKDIKKGRRWPFSKKKMKNEPPGMLTKYDLKY